MKIVLIPWPQMPPVDGGREFETREDCYLRLVDEARRHMGAENRPTGVWDWRKKTGQFWVAYRPRGAEEKREAYRPCRRSS